jgi:hypothetical protein
MTPGPPPKGREQRRRRNAPAGGEWVDPTQWTRADTYYALDTLRLIDLNEREPRSSFAGEIRLRMGGLGLTPKGKRNLRWRMAEPAKVLDHPTLSRRPASPAPPASRRCQPEGRHVTDPPRRFKPEAVPDCESLQESA